MKMTKTKKVLGKGLESLIPDIGNRDSFVEVDINKISGNKYQPRKKIENDANFLNLVESIKEKDIIEPLILKQEKNGKYSLIAGERRYRAAIKAGKTKVPAIIKSNITDAEAYEIALIENIHREDINAIEEAEAFQELIKQFNYTHEQLAQKLGLSRTKITNTLRLNKLPSKVKEWIMSSQLSEGHAKVLLGINDEELLTDIAKKVITQGLSVRQTEELVKNIKSPKKRSSGTQNIDPNITDLIDKISYSLNSKVDIKGNLKKGKIIIYYKDSEQLEQLVKHLKKQENLED